MFWINSSSLCANQKVMTPMQMGMVGVGVEWDEVVVTCEKLKKKKWKEKKAKERCLKEQREIPDDASRNLSKTAIFHRFHTGRSFHAFSHVA